MVVTHVPPLMQGEGRQASVYYISHLLYHVANHLTIPLDSAYSNWLWP